jgi:hypothetical protein
VKWTALNKMEKKGGVEKGRMKEKYMQMQSGKGL